ncbi:MAG: hypothetical protein ABIF87_12755 [Pseudomonadota bacterium]
MAVAIEKKNTKTGEVNTKMYETVAERARKFREICSIQEGWALVTDISFPDPEIVLAVARVVSPDGREVAKGTAEENRKASYINKTSAVENAETSAIGRCLFAAGFGGGEFCSAEELLTALRQQEDIQKAELQAVNGNKTQTKKPPQGNGGNGKTKPGHLGPEIKGIIYRKEGNLIVADGNTFQSKGLLKSAGFNWNEPMPNAWAKKEVA